MSAEPTARPWRAVLAALAWFVAAAAAGAPFHLLAQRGSLPPGPAGVASLLATSAVMLVPALHARPLRDWLRAGALPVVAVGAAFVLVLLANRALVQWLPVPVADIGTTAPDAWMFPRAAMIALLVPVAEELFFRGWLWARLAGRWPPRAVGLATGLLFALAHLQFAASVLPIAVALTWLRQRSGGLRAPLALHVLMNSLTAGLSLLP